MFFENFVTIEASLKQKGKILTYIMTCMFMFLLVISINLKEDLGIRILVMFYFDTFLILSKFAFERKPIYVYDYPYCFVKA